MFETLVFNSMLPSDTIIKLRVNNSKKIRDGKKREGNITPKKKMP
jgi:hypothetical protein